MKKLFTLALFIPLFSLAQNTDETTHATGFLQLDSATGKVIFREVVQLDSNYSADRIFKLVKEWMSTKIPEFNRSNSEKNYGSGTFFTGVEKGNATTINQYYKNDEPLKLQDNDSKKLIARCILKYTGSSMGCLRVIFVDYNVTVLCKDGKYRIDISDINYTHYNQTNFKQLQLAGFNDKGPCGSKGTIESLLECGQCKNELRKFNEYLSVDCNKVIDNLKKFITENKKADDNW